MAARRSEQNNQENPQLPYLPNEDRLNVYRLLTQGALHLWSKGQLQEDKLQHILNEMVPLVEKDPLFLAHLTSYIINSSKSKDLRVLTTYVNALSSADGTPFSEGSEYMKPNLRYVSAAAVQHLEPKEAYRVARLAKYKYSIDGYLKFSRHQPSFLITALVKYLKYREANPEMIRGIARAGLKGTMQDMYRLLRVPRSSIASSILRWQEKGKDTKFETSIAEKFKDLKDLEIAELIRAEKIPVLGAIGALPREVTPVIAVALLEQTTGNQAVILRKTFEDTGVLKDKEVKKLYEEKIATAKTALDRAETISKQASEETKESLLKARASTRKKQVGDIGKVYLHIDSSYSMNAAIDFAKEKGAIIAEIVPNPENNFAWGMFDDRAYPLPLPDKFVADAFKQILFARVAGGATDVFALYPEARKFGADVDIIITDGGHNTGDLRARMRQYHEDNPDMIKPKACVIVDFSPTGTWGDTRGRMNPVKEAYEDNGVPVAVLQPETLANSALVTEAIKAAIEGPMATIDTIMDTELLTMPEWYFTI